MPGIVRRNQACALWCVPALLLCLPLPVRAESPADSTADQLPTHLRDRGPGIPTSMFGTYIEKGQLLVYPFYEFYYDHNTEYSPAEFGYNGVGEYEAKNVAHEGLIYLAYAFTDWLMVEMEAAAITDRLWKSDEDTSDMPDTLHEYGLGDVEGQLRWRFFPETIYRPYFFGYFETVFPLQPDEKMIGTQAWEFKLGLGLTKGFRFGTLSARLSVEYDGEDEEVAFGEYAVEYLKRLSEHLRLFLMVEGSGDELEGVVELQVHFNKYVYLKIGAGVGITPAATDIAPENGVMIVIPLCIR